MLLWANAPVNSIFVAMGQHPSDDHICRYGPPHPNFQMYAYGFNIYPSTILVPEDAMPMQILYLLRWADSHPKVFMRMEIYPAASGLYVCCLGFHAVAG